MAIGFRLVYVVQCVMILSLHPASASEFRTLTTSRWSPMEARLVDFSRDWVILQTRDMHRYRIRMADWL